MKKSYYEVLGVDKDSTPEQIKQSYRILSLKYHPDKNLGNQEAEEKFKEINEAYEILSNPELRSVYEKFDEERFNNIESKINSLSRKTEEFKNYEDKKIERMEREKVIMNLVSEFARNWRVEEKDLDSDLWSPYSNWREKVMNVEVGESESFRKKLIAGIQEVSKNKKNFLTDKWEAIERINKLLLKNNLNVEDLESVNRNYKREIDELSFREREKVHSIEERAKREITLKSESKKKTGGFFNLIIQRKK